MDEDGVARLHAIGAPQQVLGGEALHHDRRALLEGQRVGQLHQLTGGNVARFGVSPQRPARVGDPVARGEFGDALAHRLDDAGSLLAEAGRQRHRVEPGAMIGVDEIDADRQVADLHLAGSRRGQAGLDPLQDVGAADAVKADETGHASPQADLYDTDCTGRSEADA